MPCSPGSLIFPCDANRIFHFRSIEKIRPARAPTAPSRACRFQTDCSLVGSTSPSDEKRVRRGRRTALFCHRSALHRAACRRAALIFCLPSHELPYSKLPSQILLSLFYAKKPPLRCGPSPKIIQMKSFFPPLFRNARLSRMNSRFFSFARRAAVQNRYFFSPSIAQRIP